MVRGMTVRWRGGEALDSSGLGGGMVRHSGYELEYLLVMI